jgi:uncharacterized protein
MEITTMLAKNVPAWFEIPATQLDRATRFYETVLGVKLNPDDMGPMQMAIFPHEMPNSTGALVQAEGYTPTASGSVVYLNLAQDLNGPLGKVENAGGKVLLDKTALPENMGYFAQFLDSEGNRVGFYSQQ